MTKKEIKKQLLKEPEEYIVIEDWDSGQRLNNGHPMTKNNIKVVVEEYMRDGEYCEENSIIKFKVYKYCGTITSSIKKEVVTVLDFEGN